MKLGGELWVVYLHLTIGLLLVPKRVKADCEKINSCSCKDPSAGTIDLSPLDGKTSPKYQDQPAQGTSDPYLYSWNPCTPFDETASCSGVSGCQVSSDKTSAFPIGTQDSAQFTVEPTSGTLFLQYSASDSGEESLSVALICDANQDPGTLAVLGEISTASYELSLTSIHCCPKSGPGPSPGPSGGNNDATGLSVGSIIVIAFFGVLVVYAVSGFVIQKYGRQATGKEVIPNYSLWSAIPGLVKDGFVFTSSCGKRGSYEKV